MATQPRNIRKLLEKQRKNLEVVKKCSTFGEMAVGLTFNPGKDPEVEAVKRMYAGLIDKLNDLRNSAEGPEKKRMHSIAITELQSSQMWAVKAITWQC